MAVPWDDEILFGEISERNGLCLHGSERYPRKDVPNSRISNGLVFSSRWSDKVKAIGFVVGIGSHQKESGGSAE
jgi:hypothetical protein